MSGSGSQRRRSGLWETDLLASAEKETKKSRWPGRDKDRQRKDSSPFDEWLMSEKQKLAGSHKSAVEPTPARQPPPRPPRTSDDARPQLPPRPNPPSRHQSSSTTVTTIRTVTPDVEQMPTTFAGHDDPAAMAAARPFTPHNANLASPRTTSSPRGSSKSRRLIKEQRDRDRESPPGSRNGASSSGSNGLPGSSILSRRKSSSQQRSRGMTDTRDIEPVPTPNRPRTKTMEERRREPSPGLSLLSRSRKRQGSVNTSAAAEPPAAAQPIAIPASHHVGTATTVLVGSPTQASIVESVGRRSGTPTTSTSFSTIDPLATLPVAIQRRVWHLVKTLNGKMGGAIEFRRDVSAPWMSGYCYIDHRDFGRLLYEASSGGPHQTLISHLQGANVNYNMDTEVLFIEVKSTVTPEEAHVKLATQQEFDAWFAALLHWQALEAPSPHPPQAEIGAFQAPPGPATAPSDSPHHQRRASASANRSRAGSARSDRRRSLAVTMPRENPVIKIGKMIYWETAMGYVPNPAQSSSGRSQPPAPQPIGARRWRRISGQLRENGELKLHADVDNCLISVVQLSQLSRSAIQRLDPSVLEDDNCIAIYPQYTSSYTNNQPGINRPIFLGMENRVLFEVWFVLLRAFTMPSIYGPRIESTPGLEGGEADTNQDLENMIATSTSYAFRMERSLSIKIVEAKLSSANVGLDGIFNGGSSKQQAQAAEKHGYYAEVLLDNETRGKTVVKYDPLHPIWVETFDFHDLPPVLGSASVILRRRPPEPVLAQERDLRQMPDIHADQQGVVASLGFDAACGKVDIHLDELDADRFSERWWPATNIHGQKIGEVLINARAQENIVLMARDYKVLGDLLHHFDNGLTLFMAEMVPSEVKRLSDCLLDIFQVSGRATDWIMALIEEEIDGIHKETAITRLRYAKRAGSDTGSEKGGHGLGNSEREQLVRDMNKNATLEANLLFRGNTLLTRALDTHMRRIGKEWLEESLADHLYKIVVKDMDCEVDPSRVQPSDLSRNWHRLLLYTQEVWKGITQASSRCPVELRLIFRHIRTCAEDRYGDFLRTVQYSSVSGFLFLRFFCPAVLNPNLFGIFKGDIKPRTRRTFTLIAKSLQTLANTASFGAKEPWMEPMNVFIVQHRDSFKQFVDEVCYVPTPISSASHPSSPTTSPTYGPEVVSVERHMSYATPMTIMQRLPPSSREGFPSLPYLIDQARAYADLIQLWLESVESLSRPGESVALPTKSHDDVLNAMSSTSTQFRDFHNLCEELNTRTQECLARAERAERPESPPAFQWEDVIDQLRNSQVTKDRELFDVLADRIANDPSILPEDNSAVAATIAHLRSQIEDGVTTDDEQQQTRLYDPTPPQSGAASTFDTPRYHDRSNHGTRPGSAAASTMNNVASYHHGGVHVHGSSIATNNPSAAASLSNLSSTVSSDTEHATTALPNYEREVRHRERREAARLEIQNQMEAARRAREKEKEKKKMAKLVPGLRKKRQEREVAAGSAAVPTTPSAKAFGLLGTSSSSLGGSHHGASTSSVSGFSYNE